MKTVSQLSATEVDDALEAALVRCAQSGVEDMKCHVEVTSMTNIGDLKRTLLNVLQRDENGEGKSASLDDVSSFDELRRKLF